MKDTALLFSPKPPIAEQTLRHEGQEIRYCVIVSTDKRRTRSVIKVKPGGVVELHLPKSQRRADPAALMARNAAWVVRKLDEQGRKASPPPPSRWVEGEEHWLLGERLRLAFSVSPRRHVTVAEGRLVVGGPLHSTETTQRQVETFFRQRALKIFQERIEAIGAALPWVDAPPPVKVRLMKSRWGSCSSRGSIVMNTALVKAPLALVDYVLLHELCHLKEHNHSPRFYRLMDIYMPQWKALKNELSALAPAILPQ